ncbi:hypothetical protein DFP72DRAFT_826853 [Ephemerocybe angulata]|uniref:CxC2-like cysteine cluster KDZ transposase-associated domain-containing protein n=1 Tax=Ephemerocybe angulata TaxID=980116 RepID=A0A8H6HCU0_9AGAR|nr:hypothetical protein DFP72DRAFT_826853 [Tulosesus angulatus]
MSSAASYRKWKTQADAARAAAQQRGTGTRSTSFVVPTTSPKRTQTAAPASSTTTTNSGPLPSATSDGTGTAAKPCADDVDDSVVDQFQREEGRLLQLFLDSFTDPFTLEQCACGRTGHQCTTRCNDCLQYRISCSDCFVSAHQNLPTHWAEVWQDGTGFFLRHDISALAGGFAFQTGHRGRPCPRPSSARTFTIVDVNGIHSTKIRFCGCSGSDDHVAQLMRSKLFPATFVDPKMAFTFSVLRSFYIHHLESAQAAYNFCSGLRHLTDEVFYERVANPYPQLRNAFKFWRVLVTKTKQGQAHGIDRLIPSRRKGNIIVLCPACPELYLNVKIEDLKKIPRELFGDRCRHILLRAWTTDGNFHANKFIKNTDPDNVSLFKGLGQFPENNAFQLYISEYPKKDGEKSTCSYLNAVNKQDQKKFKGMDITGVVNTQCAHVFILASVDLQLGERYSNTDYAVAHAIRIWIADGKISMSMNDEEFLNACIQLFSYDISCAYGRNADTRFAKHFPDVAEVVKRFQYLIPLVHVQNHKDDCMYRYSSAYTEHAGHFHGETAEHAWPYVNQYGPQCRQMNNGHRQDTYIGVYNHWNFKKMVNMSSQLTTELNRAHILRDQKRHAFLNLTKLYGDNYEAWNALDRTFKVKEGSSEVQSVYRHSKSKVPSQDQIYQAMIRDLHNENPSESPSKASAPVLLNEGMAIWKLQQDIQSKQVQHDDHPEKRLREDIESLREQLKKKLVSFRRVQRAVSPQITDYVAQRVAECSKSEKFRLEDEALYLPSDFSTNDIIKFGLTALGELERKILEGSAYDALSQLRRDVQFYDSLAGLKKADCHGQEKHTRERARVNEARRRRDNNMALYTKIRDALIALGMPKDDETFLPMTMTSISRKSTDVKRAIGDTYRTDGPLWLASKFRPLASQTTVEAEDESGEETPLNTTPNLGHKGKKRKLEVDGFDASSNSVPSHVSPPSNKPSQNGWIWKMASPKGVSDADVEKWLNEGDRVQWFRAEAEMYRWLEESEIKLAELLRCIEYFANMAKIWTQLAHSSLDNPGKQAYARQTAAQFSELSSTARSQLDKAGYPHINDLEGLIHHLEGQRNGLKDAINKAATGILAHDEECSSEKEGKDGYEALNTAV